MLTSIRRCTLGAVLGLMIALLSTTALAGAALADRPLGWDPASVNQSDRAGLGFGDELPPGYVVRVVTAEAPRPAVTETVSRPVSVSWIPIMILSSMLALSLGFSAVLYVRTQRMAAA